MCALVCAQLVSRFYLLLAVAQIRRFSISFDLFALRWERIRLIWHGAFRVFSMSKWFFFSLLLKHLSRPLRLYIEMVRLTKWKWFQKFHARVLLWGKCVEWTWLRRQSEDFSKRGEIERTEQIKKRNLTIWSDQRQMRWRRFDSLKCPHKHVYLEGVLSYISRVFCSMIRSLCMIRHHCRAILCHLAASCLSAFRANFILSTCGQKFFIKSAL